MGDSPELRRAEALLDDLRRRTAAIGALDLTIAWRAEDAKSAVEGGKPSYTQRLLSDRNLRLKKLGEEAVELATACADADAGRGDEDGADVVYHTLVALRAIGVSLDDVRCALEARQHAPGAKIK